MPDPQDAAPADQPMKEDILKRHTLRHRAVAFAGAVMALSLATTTPASAHNGDDHTTPPAPGAYTSKAQVVEGNLHDLPVGPLTVANWPSGPTHAVLAGSQHGLDFGTMESNANGSYEEGWVTADAAVASITGELGGILTIDLDAISSECRSDTAGQTGSSQIAGGTIRVLGYGTVDIPVNPEPNTKLSIPGVLDITLNKQVVHEDGALEVTALDIHGTEQLQTLLLTQHPLYLTVAQSTCDMIVDEVEVPAASALGLAATGGGIVVLAGSVLFLAWRRSTATAAD